MANYGDHMDTIKVSVMAKVLHDLPHFNISFQEIDNTFRPNDVKYLETLINWSLIPIVLLIITLLSFLLYLIKQCCQHRTLTTYKTITSLKFIVTIITIICCAVIGLDLYGNEIVHNGFLKFQTTALDVNTLVNRVRNQSNILEKTFKYDIRSNLSQLTGRLYELVEDEMDLFPLIDAHYMVESNITLAASYVRGVYVSLVGVNVKDFLENTNTMEYLRWPITLFALIIILLLNIIHLVGVAKHSRLILIIFTVSGLFAIITTWLMASFYLPTSIAVSDLCINPQEYLFSIAPPNLPNNIILDYTQPCKIQYINSFTQKFQECHRTLNSTRQSMEVLSEMTMTHFRLYNLYKNLLKIKYELNNAERSLNELYDLVECNSVHQHFVEAKKGLCQESLQGLTLMLVSSFIAAILLTIMVWIAAHNWIHMKGYNKYAEEDVSDNQQEILIALNALPRDDNRNFANKNEHEEYIEAKFKDLGMEANAPMLEEFVEDKKV